MFIYIYWLVPRVKLESPLWNGGPWSVIIDSGNRLSTYRQQEICEIWMIYVGAGGKKRGFVSIDAKEGKEKRSQCGLSDNLNWL